MRFVNNPSYFYINFMGIFFFPGIVKPCFRQSMGKINISWRYISFLCASEEEEHLVLSGYAERFWVVSENWPSFRAKLTPWFVTHLLFLRAEHLVPYPCYEVHTQHLPPTLLYVHPAQPGPTSIYNIPHLQQRPNQELSPAYSPGHCDMFGLSTTTMIILVSSLWEHQAEAKVVSWHSRKISGDKKNMCCCIAANILLTLIARSLDEGGKTPQVFRHGGYQGTELLPVIWEHQPNHRDTNGKLEKDQLCSEVPCSYPWSHSPPFIWHFCIGKPVRHADIFSMYDSRTAIFHGWRWTKEDYLELFECLDSDSSLSSF